MLRRFQSRLADALTKRTGSPSFAAAVFIVALLATISMSVPFASLLVTAVMLAPGRWLSAAVWASLGAALGGLVLYLVFHHLGWKQLVTAYPEVVRSSAWRDATHWLTHYGVISLLGIAALPLPLTPALMFAAISRLPILEVIAALWLGKLFKYVFYAWLVSCFQEQLREKGSRDLQLIGDLWRPVWDRFFYKKIESNL